MRWLKSTEVSLLAVFLVLVVFCCKAQAEDPVKAAGKAAEGVLEQLGSEEGINEKLAGPLINKGARLRTFDGKRSFSGQLKCSSTERFLQITVSMTKSGDLASGLVRQDTDFNKSFDYSSPLPMISGICGNGVISCTPGTWSGCRYFKWTSDSSGRICLTEAGISALKGCYCVNSSCKYNGGMYSALKALGNGAAGAIEAETARVSITEQQVSESQIVYSGQDTESCTTVETLYGSSKPEYYFSHPGKIQDDAASEAVSQKDDPESPYSLVTGSLAWNQDSLKGFYEGCKVERKAKVDLVETFCDEPAPHGQLGSVTGDKLYKVFQREVFQAKCGCGYTAVKYCPVPHADKSDSIPPHGEFYGSGAENFKPAGEGCSYDEVWLYNVCKRYSDVFGNKIVNSCAPLEAQCLLKEEKVDGIYTYRDYNPTGEVPEYSCRLVKGTYGIYSVCKPWWVKERVYHCEKDGETIEFDRKRMEVITSSVDESEDVMSYDDYRLADGTWGYESHSAGISEKETFDECEISCKVRIPSQDTQVGMTGHTGQFRSSVDGYDYFVKSCKDNVCPLDTHEELVADCQCVNEFAHSVTQMEVMKESGKDMKCDGELDESGNCTGKVEIFKGYKGACRQPGMETKWFDCCNSKPESWFIFKKFCTDEEKQTVQALENKLVHYVGKRCVKELPLVGCVQKERVFCKFHGLLGRIIQEQGRVQLKAFGTGGSWGNGDYPNCRGLSPEELQRIDFSRINFDEFVDHITTKAQGEIEDDMKHKVGDFYDGIQ